MKLYLLMMSVWSLSLFAKPVDITLLIDKNYKPYMYMQDGQASGIYAELLMAAASKLPDFTLHLQGVSWQEGKLMIKSGDALGLVGTYYHGKERPYVYPYSINFSSERVITVCAPGKVTQSPAAWPTDYDDLLVGNIQGYDGWLRDNVRSELNTRHVNFLEIPNTELALEMVIKGRLDCALSEQSAFAFFMKALKAQGKFDPTKHAMPVVVNEISNESVYIGYSATGIAKGNFADAERFRREFDYALFDLLQNGELAAIYQRYMQ